MTQECKHHDPSRKYCCRCFGIAISCCCCEFFCCRCEYSSDLNDLPNLNYWCGRTGDSAYKDSEGGYKIATPLLTEEILKEF